MPELVFPDPVSPVMSHPRQNWVFFQAKPPSRATTHLRPGASKTKAANSASPIAPASMKHFGFLNTRKRSTGGGIGSKGMNGNFIAILFQLDNQQRTPRWWQRRQLHE